MLGACPPSSLPDRTTALLLIDFQNEYFTGSLPIPDGAAALQNARQLVECAEAMGGTSSTYSTLHRPAHLCLLPVAGNWKFTPT
jgi:nicotinamidase-related amidase